MAPQPRAALRPGHRGRPLRRFLLVITAAIAVASLYNFASHRSALQRFTFHLVRPQIGGGMTSSVGSAPTPHHDSPSHTADVDNSDLQLPLGSAAEQERTEQKTEPKMEYGTNKHPAFKDDPPLLVRDLPTEHLPSYTPAAPGGKPGGGRKGARGSRLVFVGDVHGHLAELKALLDKVGFDHKHGDHLVLAGDMVTKGPDSKGVIKLAMDLGASAVRGNQEDKVLAVARELKRLAVDPGAGLDTDDDDEDDAAVEGNDGDKAGTTIRRKDHARRIARSLTRAQLGWLRSLPIILRIGRLPSATAAPWNASTIAVVHGGLVPGVPLEKQDPWAVMNMRSLVYPSRGKRKGAHKHGSRDGDAPSSAPDPFLDLALDAVAVPIENRDGEPWSHAWNRHQNLLPATAAHTVAIYGHDAKAGLQVNLEVDIAPYSSNSNSDSGSDPGDDVDDDSHGGDDSSDPGFGSGAEANSYTDSIDNDENRNNDNEGTIETDEEMESKTRSKKKKGKKKTKKPKQPGLRYAFGLDSGCGHGKKLTALVLEAVSEGAVAHRIEQVDCADF